MSASNPELPKRRVIKPFGYESQKGKRLREHQPFVPVVLAFGCGIWLDKALWPGSETLETSLSVPLLVWLCVLAVVGVLWKTALFWGGEKASERVVMWRTRVAACFLLVCIAAAGGAWHHAYWNLYPKNEISMTFRNETALAFVEGEILRPLERYYASDDMLKFQNKDEQSTSFQLRVRRMKNKKEWAATNGVVTVRVAGNVREVHPGDVVTISGKLVHPAGAKNPGGFVPRDYCRAQRVLAILNVPTPENITLVRRPKWGGLYRLVEFLRDTARARLETSLPPESKVLAEAVVLGCRDELSRSEKETMLETGTVHLMSVSGMHVGMFAAGVLFFLGLFPLPQKWKTGILIALILLYVMITGARPPAVRAGVLVTVTSLAFMLRRPCSRMNALALAALLVLAMNPTSLFNTGTQLSFLAVGTLVYTPLFHLRKTEFDEDDSWEYWPIATREMRWRFLRSMARYYGMALWNVLYSSFVLSMVLMPLVAWKFHIVAPVGIFLNVLLSIPLMVAVVTSAVVIVFGWIPGVGWAMSGICAGALSVLEWLIHTAAKLPCTCFWVCGPTKGAVLGFYLVLVGWFLLSPFFTRKRRFAGVLTLVVLALTFLPQWLEPPRDGLRCSFISVSHGLSVLLEFPDGRNFLFDAGQFAAAEIPQRTIAEYLWFRRVHRLDAVFISHPDLDHYNALPGLLDRFPVDVIYTAPVAVERMKSAAEAAVEAEDAAATTAAVASSETATVEAVAAGVPTTEATMVGGPTADAAAAKAASSAIASESAGPTKGQVSDQVAGQVTGQTAGQVANPKAGQPASQAAGQVTDQPVNQVANQKANRPANQAKGPVSKPAGTAEAANFYAMRQQRETPTDAMLVELYRAIQKHQVPLEPLTAGSVISIGEDCSLEVFHPRADLVEENSNANSLVILLKYQNHTVLLTGDLGPPGTQRVLDLAPPEVTVLQVPHHGGPKNNTPAFVRWAHPQYAVISETPLNAQATTTELFTTNGAQVFHSGRQGAVICTFRNGEVKVEAFGEP